MLGAASYINADFASGAGSSMKLGACYLLGGNLSTGVEYDPGYRESSIALPGYTRQIVELRLSGGL